MDGIVSVVAFAGSLKRLGLGLPVNLVILNVDPPVPPMYAKTPWLVMQYLPVFPLTVAERQVEFCPANFCVDVVTLMPSARATAADLSSFSTLIRSAGLKAFASPAKGFPPPSEMHCRPPALVVVVVEPVFPLFPEFPEFPLFPELPLLPESLFEQ
jgi:hypothetical protein